MSRNLRTTLFTFLLLLAACSTSNDKISDLEWQRLQEPLRQENQAKAEFAARYQSYRCEEVDVPAAELSEGPGTKFRSMQFGDHLTLKLKLGKLIHLNGDENGGPTRTESRYELYWDGKLMAKAESLFSRRDETFAEDTGTTFAYDPSSQCLLVYEDLGWTTTRYIAFEYSGTPDEPSNWTAKHLKLPARDRAGGPTVERGRLRSFGNGKAYLEMDDQWYAFPVDDFLVANLAFTIG